MNTKTDDIKRMIVSTFSPGTASLHDYTRAKQLIQTGFSPDEYAKLIKFIADYLGV